MKGSIATGKAVFDKVTAEKNAVDNKVVEAIQLKVAYGNTADGPGVERCYVFFPHLSLILIL